MVFKKDGKQIIKLLLINNKMTLKCLIGGHKWKMKDMMHQQKDQGSVYEYSSFERCEWCDKKRYNRKFKVQYQY